MSDGKRKGNPGDGEWSTKQTAKGTRIFDALSKICGIAKELREDVVAVEDFERLLDNQKKFHADLKSKEAEIQKLRKTKDDEIANLTDEIERLKTDKDVLWKEFSAKQKDFQDQLSQFEDTRNTLRETREQLRGAKDEAKCAKAENKKFCSTLTKQNHLLKKKDKDLEISETKCEELKFGSAIVERNLRRLEDFVRVKELRECDVESNEFEELADECHNLAFEFFRAVGEPPASLPSAVASLKNMPLSLSMSGPAEVMRCAVAEFIIGKALTDHIFVDMYFRKPDLRHAVSTMLDYLEARDSYAEAEDSHAQSGYLRREPMVRIQLLAEAETDNEARLRVINSAKRDVCDSLDHLLPSSFTRDVFHGRLEELLAQAMDLWGPLQRSKFRASAEFAVTAQLDRQDDFYTEFGGPVEGEQAEPIILLFPQISIANEIICSAKALWSDQAIVVAAKEELEKARNHGKMKKQEPPKKLMKRRLSVRQREIPVPSPGVSSGEGRPDEVKQGLIGHGKGPQSSSDVTAVVALRSKEVLSGPKT